MIHSLSLNDEEVVQQIWEMQHAAYRLEAELIGFTEIPPLMDTCESIRTCGETFYGCMDEDGELMGAVAVISEGEGSLTISRVMVSPDHFRKGVASRLIQHVLAAYPEMSLFIVSTGEKNKPAYSLYLKHGFVPFDTFEVAPGVELTTFHLRR